jgi:hypothetical protein
MTRAAAFLVAAAALSRCFVVAWHPAAASAYQRRTAVWSRRKLFLLRSGTIRALLLLALLLASLLGSFLLGHCTSS